MAARATQSGTISFGLVSIPVKFYTAASSEQVRFNMLHSECGGRIKQQLYCPVHDDVVARSDTTKGYEYSKGEYVQFEEDELKALEASRDSSINIVEFVPLDSFDFIQVEKSYYLGPDKGGDKAYRLLSQSMAESQKVAVGRWAARGKEQLVVVRPYRDGLIFHQMYYADEVRAFEDVDTGAIFEFHDAEKQLAHQLIEQLSSKKFDVDKYEDSFRGRVLTAVEQKVAGQKLQLAPEAPRAQIIDLVEALKQSLEGARSGASGAGADDAQPLPPKKVRKSRPKKKVGGSTG
jgi:DNA end-binding protein Ku